VADHLGIEPKLGFHADLEPVRFTHEEKVEAACLGIG
jgi:hypothetical protein